MDLVGVREDAVLPVTQHSAFFPTAFEQLVKYFDVLIGDFVAVAVIA